MFLEYFLSVLLLFEVFFLSITISSQSFNLKWSIAFVKVMHIYSDPTVGFYKCLCFWIKTPALIRYDILTHGCLEVEIILCLLFNLYRNYLLISLILRRRIYLFVGFAYNLIFIRFLCLLIIL